MTCRCMGFTIFTLSYGSKVSAWKFGICWSVMYVCFVDFLAQLLAQRCLCNWSSVNLTFLPNNLRLPGNVPPRQRPLVEGDSTRH